MARAAASTSVCGRLAGTAGGGARRGGPVAPDVAGCGPDRVTIGPAFHHLTSRVAKPSPEGYANQLPWCRVNPWVSVSALVLAIERVAYAVIWHRPDLFVRACRQLTPGHDPVDVLARLFAVFKVVQGVVFVGWCLVHGGTLAPFSSEASALAGGGALALLGQLLNLSVFSRSGRTGVFYGNRRHDVPWVNGFPFSVVRHPQYVGTVLSIWGVFLVMRYPAPDWAALPLLETVYYGLGALSSRWRRRPRSHGKVIRSPQRLTDAHQSAFSDVRTEPQRRRCQRYDGGAVREVADLVAARDARLAPQRPRLSGRPFRKFR